MARRRMTGFGGRSNSDTQNTGSGPAAATATGTAVAEKPAAAPGAAPAVVAVTFSDNSGTPATTTEAAQGEAQPATVTPMRRRNERVISLVELPDPDELVAGLGQLSPKERAAWEQYRQGVEQGVSSRYVMGKCLSGIQNGNLCRDWGITFKEYLEQLEAERGVSQSDAYRMMAEWPMADEFDRQNLAVPALSHMEKLGPVVKVYGRAPAVTFHQMLNEGAKAEGVRLTAAHVEYYVGKLIEKMTLPSRKLLPLEKFEESRDSVLAEPKFKEIPRQPKRREIGTGPQESAAPDGAAAAGTGTGSSSTEAGSGKGPEPEGAPEKEKVDLPGADGETTGLRTGSASAKKGKSTIAGQVQLTSTSQIGGTPELVSQAQMRCAQTKQAEENLKTIVEMLKEQGHLEKAMPSLKAMRRYAQRIDKVLGEAGVGS